MSINYLLILCILTVSTVSAQQKMTKFENDYSQIVETISNYVQDSKNKVHNAAYERLAYLVDTYGTRLWGSQSLEMVIDELIDMGNDIGFDATYKDPVVDFTKWVRKDESLTLYDPRPFPQDLKMTGIGLSISGDVKAEVLVVTDWDDLELRKSQAKGKIVCYSTQWVDYDTTVDYRVNGASKASEYGAVGALIRSVTPFSIESPHTGSLYYNSNYPKIPAAAISVEDANMFLRMRERGQKIVVHLKMDNEFIDGANSANVIAEIQGSEYPNEIILFGGHMDSWDVGSQTGANDDGGGFITCFEALRVIKELGWKPKRTMRFIGWSGEEYGGENSGAWQYMRQREDEMKDHVVAFESDLGSSKPWGFGFTGSEEAVAMVEAITLTSFKSIDCDTIINGDGSMTDTEPLSQKGVPTMRNMVSDLSEHSPYYFTFHHSAGDSMDLMDPDWMDLNVSAIASMMFIIADMDERLPQVQN